MVKYFWDSYAIIELLKGNPGYIKYKDEPIIITKFNLVEIYWSFLRDYDEERADMLYDQFKECVVDISDETTKEAIKFRKKNKKRDLSYADCIGYQYALDNDLFFLTGDKEFCNMKNVIFVK